MTQNHTTVTHIVIDPCNESIGLSKSQLSINNASSLSNSSSYDFSGSCVAIAGSKHSDLCRTLEDHLTPDSSAANICRHSPDLFPLSALEDRSSQRTKSENFSAQYLVGSHKNGQYIDLSPNGAKIFGAKKSHTRSAWHTMSIVGARPTCLNQKKIRQIESPDLLESLPDRRRSRSFSLQSTLLAQTGESEKKRHDVEEEEILESNGLTDVNNEGDIERPTFQLFTEYGCEAQLINVSYYLFMFM